jgi:hypothetical protein
MSAVAQLTSRVDKLSAALKLDGPSAATMVRTIGPPLKADLLAVAARAFGTDLKPFAAKNVKANVGYDEIAPVPGCAWAIGFKLRPVGVWVFGQYGAPHAYLIGVAKGRGKKKRPTTLQAKGYAHPVRGPILHPPIRGRRAIDGAYRAIRSRQTELVRKGFDAVLEEVWRG